MDRFYKGDIGLGKFFFIVINFFWAIADLFLVWKGNQERNFEKLNS